MVQWHHQLNEHEFEQTLGDGEGQGSLACCSPWVAKSQTQLKQLSMYAHTRAREPPGSPQPPLGDAVTAVGQVGLGPQWSAYW